MTAPDYTPDAVQKTLAHTGASIHAFEAYAQNLRFGEVFARNDIYQSLVVQCALVEEGLVVLTRTAEADAIKDWAVAMITIRGELFVHRSEHQYFTLQGALKTFCELTGESLDESIDDYS